MKSSNFGGRALTSLGTYGGLEHFHIGGRLDISKKELILNLIHSCH